MFVKPDAWIDLRFPGTTLQMRALPRGNGQPVSSRQNVKRHCSRYVKYTAWLT